MYDTRMAPETMDSDNVHALLDEVAGHLNAQHGRLIDLTVWLLDNSMAWQGDGVWTAAQFLAWRCGVSPSTARNVVHAAERIAELPESIELVRRGVLSLDQLMPIVRKAPAWGDAQLASLAPRLTVAQVQRVCRDTDWSWGLAQEQSAPGVSDPIGSADDTITDAVHEVEVEVEAESVISSPVDENRVSYGSGPDGRWWLHADLDADLGALVEASFHEARDALFRELIDGADKADDGPAVLVNDVDALVAVAERSLGATASPARRDRFRVNLFMDLAGTLLTTEHITIPESIARLVTCDGRIDPVFVDGATPVSVGRSQRTVPDRLRRIVLFRDTHCCQVPGCTASRGLDLHHIVHWADEGSTDSCNLITICSRHHRMHHKRRLGITGNADRPETLRFVNASGVEIRRSGATPARPNGPPPEIIGQYEHPIGERLDGRWVTFTNPDVPPDERWQHPGLTG